ncbi:hypothetical protein DXG01_003919 [Tephrocybe rancida]|nr:hypothetical protein DXG01_003919 [Tephrocybe rancida]
MAPPPTLALEAIDTIDKLKSCSPHLMPFHIDYSGPAPISTYLRVHAAKETVGAPAPPEEPASDTQPVSDTQPESGPSDDSTDNVVSAEGSMEVDATPPAPVASSPSLASLATRVTDATTRFVSSFRGRTIQGLKVPVPEGYMGVVLRADDASGSQMRANQGRGPERKTAQTNRTGKRETRSSRSAEARGEYDEQEDEMMDINEEEIQTLSVASRFSNFVVWQADHPVDEGRDEYLRSVNEWTQLARLV